MFKYKSWLVKKAKTVLIIQRRNGLCKPFLYILTFWTRNVNIVLIEQIESLSVMILRAVLLKFIAFPHKNHRIGKWIKLKSNSLYNNDIVDTMEQEQHDLSHHKRLEYCTSRLSYRDGRKLTAVKVNILN